jgi:hypothetical protein
MLSTKTRNTIIALAASLTFAGVAAPASMADSKQGTTSGKGCTVNYTDSKGKTSTISMEDGASITLGTSTITCNNGNTTTTPGIVKAPKKIVGIHSISPVVGSQKL